MPAVLRGLAAREGGGAGAAELVAGDLMAGWVDALRRFATLSASETQAARPGALRGEVGFSVDLMRLPDSDLLVLALSLSYLDLKRIAVSLLTVVLSGQLIGFVQNARVPQAEG